MTHTSTPEPTPIDTGSVVSPALRSHRARVVADVLEAHGLDALLVVMFDNVRWVSEIPLCDYAEQLHDGYAAIVDRDGAVDVLTMFAGQDEQVVREPHAELPHVRSLAALPACYPRGIDPGGFAAAVARLLRGRGLSRLGVDELPANSQESLLAAAPGLSCVPVAADLQRRRTVKHPDEIALLREGAAILDVAVTAGLRSLAEGGSEREAGAAFAASGYAQGVEGVSHLLMRTGQRDAASSDANPWSQQSAYLADRAMQAGDAGRIDAGFYNVGGYTSDIARTVVRGTPARSLAEAYARLCDAYDATVTELVPGTPVSRLWELTRDRLENLGYAPYRQLCGHSIGLRVTEVPMITAPTMLADDVTLEADMVIAFEFHVVHSGQPLSIEDMWLVGGGTPSSLTHASRSLDLGG